MEINNTLESINSRLVDAEECINDLEDWVIEGTQVEQQKEKFLKNIRLRGLLDNIMQMLTIIMVPEEESRKLI